MDSTARAALARQLDAARRGPAPAPRPTVDPAAYAFRARLVDELDRLTNLAELAEAAGAGPDEHAARVAADDVRAELAALDYRAAIAAPHRDNLAELPAVLAAAARRERVGARPVALTDRRDGLPVAVIERDALPPVPAGRP